MIIGISNQNLRQDYQVYDLVPQAILNTPISYFAGRLGMIIEQDADDLDSFEGTALVMNDTYPVAIRHYHGHPKDTVTVYLSSNIKDIEKITNIIGELIADLKLPKTAIHWERIDSPLS